MTCWRRRTQSSACSSSLSVIGAPLNKAVELGACSRLLPCSAECTAALRTAAAQVQTRAVFHVAFVRSGALPFAQFRMTKKKSSKKKWRAAIAKACASASSVSVQQDDDDVQIIEDDDVQIIEDDRVQVVREENWIIDNCSAESRDLSDGEIDDSPDEAGEAADVSNTSMGKISEWMSTILNSVCTPESVKVDNSRPKSRKVCWNCDGDHNLADCEEKRNNAKIARARAQFLEKKSTSDARYHDEKDDKKSKFRAGIVSDSLRSALGIGHSELPEWIYRMRKMGFERGYPPAYLKQAIVKRADENAVLTFHGDDAEDLNLAKIKPADSLSLPPEVDRNKVIYYAGFNKHFPNLVDKDIHNWRIPPFDDFVDLLSKKVEREFTSKQRKSKRAHDADNEEPVSKKKAKQEPKTTVKDAEVEPCSSTASSSVVPSSPTSSVNDASAVNGSLKSSALSTPVMTRKHKETGNIRDDVVPDLKAFASGLAPMIIEEDLPPRKGLFKEAFSKIRAKMDSAVKGNT